MSSTKSQVAVATNIPNLSSSSQQQKDYNTEESLGRQNSFGLNRRGNMKGKHLTRSHAMREATSPPRTPTPRASESSSSQISPNGYQQQTHHHQQLQQHQQQHMQHMDVNENNNNNKLHTQSSATRGNSPIVDTPTVIVTSQHKQQQQQQQHHHHQQQHTNVALCNETEFPKLTPPKSKGGGGGGGSGSGSSSVNNNNSGQQQQRINNNAAEGHNNNCNKKANGDSATATVAGVNETHNKGTNTNAGNANKSYNNQQSQHQQQQHQQQQHQQQQQQHPIQQPFNAGNALQKALNITDNTQSTPIYNSPMNYQLHPNNGGNQQQQQQQQPASFIVYDKENRCPRNDSQNSMNSNDEMHYETQQQQQSQHQQHQSQQQQHHQRSGGGGGGGGGKKHRTNSNSKGSKPRLKSMGGSSGGGISNSGPGGGGGIGNMSSGSIDGGGGAAGGGSLNSSNNTSGFISRENSNEQYTDHGGTDLLSFFKETLNKNVKDRQFLLKVEKDLIEFVQEGSRGEIRFPQASSYNRMLIHRTAAFFGMEHNVDTETQQCVIVAPTKNTRIPEIRFKTLVIHNREDSRKSILKRDTHSFDDSRQSSYLCPDRGGMLDRKAKSFEEREEDYDRARSRIFNRSQNEACGGGGGGGGGAVGSGSTDDDNNYISWTSSVDQQQFSRGRPTGKVIKIQNSPDGGRTGSVVPKSNNNYGNYGGGPTQAGAPLMRGDSVSSNKSGNGGGGGGGGGNGTRIYSKQDSAGGSTNTSWRLSPSSSGYKTQTQSVRSDSVTPSPTGGYGSDEHIPDHSAVIANREENIDAAAVATSVPNSGLVWAVTDISNVPKGSILINPQTLQPILNADGTVYHYDPSNMPPAQAMTPGGGGGGGGGNVGPGIYHPNQNNSSPQQHAVVHNSMKKQHKGHQIQQQQQQQQQPQQQQPLQAQQQFNKIESTTLNTGVETVSESSTQTMSVAEEIGISNTVVDASYQEVGGDLCSQDDNDECDNSASGCLSITTTTSTKNYDRIEVQKFKNQATSPNIPINEKEDLIKNEHSSQTPTNVTPSLQPQQQQPPPPPPQQPQAQPQSQPPQNRETPHSSRSTPFSNSDTLTKRSSEEPRATSWTQSYQAPDGSTVFHTTATPNSSNPYCTTTYQQGPDGSIYAVPQGMIYAYPPPVEGEFQGYFMPVFDPSQQQRGDTTGLLQPGTQTIYPTGGATTMVPVAAYPTAQFTTTNGAPIYPGQVIYSGEQFQTASAPLAATAPASAAGQLQQIPMTTYPIGYPYPYNGYWGQTMTYYVPQQAVPATASLLTAPPSLQPSTAPNNGTHVAGVVNATGPSGGNLTAGPSNNSSNTTNSSSSGANGNILNASHPNAGVVTTGYHQTHGGHSAGVVSGGGAGGTTYYGTGRIKRPAPAHFGGGSGVSGGHQVLTATALPNGVGATTYQLGHAVPTLTLAAAAPQNTAGSANATSDLSGGGGGAPTAATMYALPQHATIFPANMFPYAANAAAAQTIGQQAAGNMAPQATIIPTQGNQQGGHVTAAAIGGHASAAVGAIHNPHHSNTVITPFYTTTTHHHAPHPGIHSAGAHTIHAPGPAAIPIVDPASLGNPPQGGHNSTYNGRGGGGGPGNGGNGTSQSAPSTPHSMPSTSVLHHAQRNPSVFSTPPIMNTSGGGGGGGVGNFSSTNSTSHYYGSNEQSHQAAAITVTNNSPHNSYVTSTYDKRSNTGGGGGGGGGGGKKPLTYQSASLSRQNSTNAGGGYSGSGKPSPLLNNNDTRSSPSSSTNSRPHSIKRSGGDNKPQTPLLSGPPSYASGNVNIQNTAATGNNVGYQSGGSAAVEMGPSGGSIPIVNVSKPPIRLNAAAAAFRQKGTTGGGGGSIIEYRRNPTSQRNSPGTNASSNDNSNNNSPNSIHNSSNAATPIAAGCYAAAPPSYMINAQNSIGDPASQQQHHAPPSLYITTAPARGPAHIPPHLQAAAASGATVSAGVPQQSATAVLGGAAAAAAAADVANAAAVAAAAATVAHHHHHQPLLGTYNPGASGLYFKYGHTYFAHPSVALPNSRRSPSTDMRPPIAQMAGMYPTVNMMIPAQPRHPGRHPNPNYKGTRPR